MSEHGFLQPNPALFDLEARLAGRTGPRLAHELGAGAECVKCGDICPGFQLHFWRKVCLNCRCGKGEHNVREESDHGVTFVGKIFDRPLRTRAEELKFIYGSMVEEGEVEHFSPGQEVMLEWAPPGVSNSLATKYLRSLPEGHLPIQGSEGAMRRKRQLEKQFPLHDVEPKSCHDLTEGEIDTMSSYVDNVKKNVAGQGIVQELADKDWRLRDTPSPPPPLPPPPMELLSADTSSYTLSYASPGYSGDYKHRPGSTGSSVTSATPSPPPELPTSTVKPGKVWLCAGCGEEMCPGSVAIFAERAGADRCWHPSCFCCSSCGDMLEDLLYFYNRGQLYCGRDFARLMNIPRCGACDELIFATEYTGAEDKVWHLKHFCCYVCDGPLAGHKYIPVDGQPHCLACWQRDYGKVCSSCKKVIDPQAQRVSLGSDNWHATEECFRCGVCSKSLLGGKMSRRSGTLLCSSKCGQELARRQTSGLPLTPAAPDTSEASHLQGQRPSSHLQGHLPPGVHHLGPQSPLSSPSQYKGSQSPSPRNIPSPTMKLGTQSPLSSQHSSSNSSLSSGHSSHYSNHQSFNNKAAVASNKDTMQVSSIKEPYRGKSVMDLGNLTLNNRSYTNFDKKLDQSILSSKGPNLYKSQSPYPPHGSSNSPIQGPPRNQLGDMSGAHQGLHSRTGSYSTIV